MCPGLARLVLPQRTTRTSLRLLNPLLEITQRNEQRSFGYQRQMYMCTVVFTLIQSPHTSSVSSCGKLLGILWDQHRDEVSGEGHCQNKQLVQKHRAANFPRECRFTLHEPETSLEQSGLSFTIQRCAEVTQSLKQASPPRVGGVPSQAAVGSLYLSSHLLRAHQAYVAAVGGSDPANSRP